MKNDTVYCEAVESIGDVALDFVESKLFTLIAGFKRTTIHNGNPVNVQDPLHPTAMCRSTLMQDQSRELILDLESFLRYKSGHLPKIVHLAPFKNISVPSLPIERPNHAENGNRFVTPQTWAFLFRFNALVGVSGKLELFHA